MPKPPWPIEHDTMLRKLWADDYSASEIAEELGRHFHVRYSRNAICGRLHRQGLSRPRSIPRPRPPKAAKAIPVQPPAPERKRSTRFNPPPLDPAEIQLRAADVVPLHLSLLDLEPRQCRYPYGDGPFTFCGNPSFGDESYCEAHTSLCTGQGTRGERAAERIARRAA